MQATCENCGKTITPEDFRAGRYYIFWVTPTIPPVNLYLCQDCRHLSIPEQERLFQDWMEERGLRRTKNTIPTSHSGHSRRKTQKTSSAKESSPSRGEDSEKRRHRLQKLELAQMTFDFN